MTGVQTCALPISLVNLGYKRVEAFGAVARATQRLGTDAKIDAVIRAALQELSR